MKIKDLLQKLIENVEDRHFIMGGLPAHGAECKACQAVRMALELINSIHLRDVFDSGNEVAIGDVTGIVESVDIVYTVRLTGADGKRRYGRFASEYVTTPPATPQEPTHYSDSMGDIWRVVGEKTLRLLECGGEIISEKATNNCAQAEVEQLYGPLVPVKR